jgi:hypothetical protein
MPSDDHVIEPWRLSLPAPLPQNDSLAAYPDTPPSGEQSEDEATKMDKNGYTTINIREPPPPELVGDIVRGIKDLPPLENPGDLTYIYEPEYDTTLFHNIKKYVEYETNVSFHSRCLDLTLTSYFRCLIFAHFT